jgi:hypothetical protein
MEREGSKGAAGRAESEEALRRLEDRLARASEAAERLIAEAAASARRQSDTPEQRVSDAADEAVFEKPPPAGWQQRQEGQRGEARREIELIAQAVEAVRDLIPPEIQRRLAEALRELLLAVRALIDWYLERSERGRRERSEVQDIPIQ